MRWLGLALLLAGCGDQALGPEPDVVQVGVTGQFLPLGPDSLLDSLVVTVRDPGSRPIAGAWVRLEGPGSATPTAGRTGSGGTILVVWRVARPAPGTTVQLSACLAERGGGACRAEAVGLVSHTGQP